MTATTGISKPFRVAIIGAGIGGLALAAAITHLIPEGAVQIDIYEQAKEIKEVGAGIFCWARTWDVIQRIGLSEALDRLLPPDRKPNKTEKTLIMTLIKSDQKNSVEVLDFYHTGRTCSFHRADMQKAMLDSLPPSVGIHLSHRLVSYDERDDKVILNFDNISLQECDLLVGADGINSHVRSEFISKRLPDQVECIKPTWSGTIMYRSLIDATKLREEYPNHIAFEKPISYIGDGQSMVSYPIMQGRFINVAAQVTDYSKEGTQFNDNRKKAIDKEQLLSIFDGWSDEALGIIKHMDKCLGWVLEYVKPPRSFGVGRVALLGDAAHAMLPYQGQGAGQAIEDAYTLSLLLRKSLNDNTPVHRVTEAYSKSRNPLASLVLQTSGDAAKLVTFRAPGYEDINKLDDDTVEELLKRFVVDYTALYDWMESVPVDEEVEKALQML